MDNITTSLVVGCIRSCSLPLQNHTIQSIIERKIVPRFTLQNSYAGLVPTFVRSTFQTQVGFYSNYLALHITQRLFSLHTEHSVLKAACIGFFTSFFDSLFHNPLRHLQVLQVITKNNLYTIVQTKGFSLFTDTIHWTTVFRIQSGVIMFSSNALYKELLGPDSPSFIAQAAAGATQVICTTPLYNFTIHKQKDSSIKLLDFIKKDYKTLCVYGVGQRLLISLVITPLILNQMEKNATTAK